MDTNLLEHLITVLNTHKMSHVDELLAKYNKRRDEVKESLQEYYKNEMYSPFNSGSYAKHTAINCKFDLDIIVPFKRNSFSKIEDMYNDVYDFLLEKFNDVAEVRKQKVSIGVLFFEDGDGDIVNIDIVPGREVIAENYSDSKNLNLHFNEGLGLYSKNSYLKTNIHAQIDHIRGKSDERQIIRLLKIWKNSNSKKYKSFFLELITIKAFDKDTITGDIWEKLKKVMTYVHENVTKDDFTLIDPGNSNNKVSDSLDTGDKYALASDMENMINAIERNSNNIKSYFPINEDYESKVSSESYGIKGREAGPTIPVNINRFG